MAESVPYVSFYPSDWMGGCATLPPMVEWVYHQICLHNWDKGDPVSEKRLSMILMRHPGGKEGWSDDLELLIEIGKLVRTESGSIWSKRALLEANRAKDALNRKKAGGRKGAQKRWNNSDEDSLPIGHPSNSDGTPNGNQNQNQNQREANASPPYSPPGDLLLEIDKETWATFIEHRIKLKAPLTDRASKMIITELTALHEQRGHHPNDVLRQSVMRGWKGVFPLAEDYRNAGTAQPDRRDGFEQALDRRIAGRAGGTAGSSG